MYNILFVCLGNICRSPMAEMIFKQLIANNKMGSVIHCESRGTSTEEYGNDMYPQAVQVLQEHHIPVTRNIVNMVRTEDYNRYGLIVCMDMENYYDLMNIFRGDPEKKIKLLMNLVGKDEEIADPWYTGDFETAYKKIEEGCIALFNIIYNDYQSKKTITQKNS